MNTYTVVLREWNSATSECTGEPVGSTTASSSNPNFSFSPIGTPTATYCVVVQQGASIKPTGQIANLTNICAQVP